MHMEFLGLQWVLAWSRTLVGLSLYVKRVLRGLQGAFQGRHCQSTVAQTFKNAISRIDQDDQGFTPSIIDSEWKKCQGTSEMISGIISRDSSISVEFI